MQNVSTMVPITAHTLVSEKGGEYWQCSYRLHIVQARAYKSLLACTPLRQPMMKRFRLVKECAWHKQAEHSDVKREVEGCKVIKGGNQKVAKYEAQTP